MSHLDLQEQEQIAELKAFWNKYGNFILTVVTLVLFGFALKNGWTWWSSRQAAQAAVVYENLEKAVAEKNAGKIKDFAGTLSEDFKRTPYAERGLLMAAKANYESGDARAAQAQLQWVVDHAKDPEYAAAARIRLAGVLLDEDKTNEALKVLDATVPTSFEGLLADRKGDVYLAAKDKAKAKEQFEKSLAALPANDPWRTVVQMKLDSVAH